MSHLYNNKDKFLNYFNDISFKNKSYKIKAIPIDNLLKINNIIQNILKDNQNIIVKGSRALNKFVNNNIVSDTVYKINTDLDYASVRYGLNLNHNDTILKNQIAPILNPQSNQPRSILWGSAPDMQNSSRIPDNWSNNQEYKHPIDSIL